MRNNVRSFHIQIHNSQPEGRVLFALLKSMSAWQAIRFDLLALIYAALDWYGNCFDMLAIIAIS